MMISERLCTLRQYDQEKKQFIWNTVWIVAENAIKGHYLRLNGIEGKWEIYTVADRRTRKI